MKILNLSFANINSLAGEWSINFTAQPFTEGLFVLTGPTGAGKTSVLDAICLALYGQTVREETISREHNEVMTRGTGQCHAEVTFEVESRKYRSRWSQIRARKKPGGGLQNAEREVADADTEKILANQLRTVEAKIQELTGMSFDQFTRAVLLAQGKFDTFLKAKDNDRADILEKITNTGAYSQIGAAVFARFQTERQKTELLEATQAAITVLTGEDRAKLDEQLADARKRRDDLVKELENLTVQLQWHNAVEVLEKEKGDFAEKRAALEARRASLKAEFDKLETAEKARKLDLDLQSLDTDRTAANKASVDLTSRIAHNTACEARQQAIGPRLTDATEKADRAKIALDSALPKLAAVRDLDHQINLAERDRKNAEKALEAAERLHREAVEAATAAQASHRDAKITEEEACRYQETHAADGTIGTLFPPIESRHGSWEVIKRKAVESRNRADALRIKVDEAGKKAREAKSQATVAAALAQRAKADLDAHVPRLQVAKDARNDARNTFAEVQAAWKNKEQAFNDQIELVEKKLSLAREVASLEEAREQLKDGCPCPLCGATSHPYATGKIPVLSAAEQELKAIREQKTKVEKAVAEARYKFDQTGETLQEQEEKNKGLTDGWKNAENKTELSAQAANAAAEAAETANSVWDSENGEAGRASREAEAAWAEIAGSLVALGVTNPKAEGWALIVGGLKKRQGDYEDQVRLDQTAKARIQEALKAIEAAARRVQSAFEDQGAKKSELGKKTEAHKELSGKRQAVYGSLDPVAEENSLRNAQATAAKSHADILGEKAAIDQACASAREEVAKAEAQHQKAEKTFRDTAARVSAHCVAIGFADDAACRAARWTDQDIARVASLKVELAGEAVQFETRITDNAAKLAAEQAKALTDRPAAELSAELSARQAVREDADKVFQDFEFKLRADDVNRERQSAQGAELDIQKTVFNRWKKMNDLIGNDGGARFKKYAQGITLSRLLKVANPHLAGMTGNRYALLWDAHSGDKLLPEVIDTHQAEARRPVSNLSGGETFMVSLALALGLSGMASGKFKVDSLFLDEGFGTLDNDALDRSIGILNQLHQSQGKLIGVISHIDQLKNQISTRIEVRKLGGGRSELSGPGVVGHAPARMAPDPEAEGATTPPVAPKKRGRPSRKALSESVASSSPGGSPGQDA